jgi:NifU-like protein involved in Fe-S cluster formation
MTEKVKGMTVAEAKKYPWKKIVEDLGGLPHQKVHCSIMAVDGLKKAIADYEKNIKPVAKVAKKTVKKIIKK